MKIAYLITAYNNFEHLERLINALDDDTQPCFFLHIDRKSRFPKYLKGRTSCNFIRRRKIWWGGWSHQAAILSLMEAALYCKADYYVLLSGADYPIRPNEFLYEKLENGFEYINMMRGFNDHKSIDRIKYYYFDLFDRRDPQSFRTRFFSRIEKRLRKLRTKEDKLPFPQIYHGSTWWALSHSTVEYIIRFLKSHPEVVHFFKTSWCPEESLIHSIIGNSKLDLQIENNLTYNDWNLKPAPGFLTDFHLALFKSKESLNNGYGSFSPFFARKFNDSSGPLITKIEKELRGSGKTELTDDK